MERKQIIEVLERMSTDDLRDYVYLGGKILENRVDKAITAALEASDRCFGSKAVIKRVDPRKKHLVMQALPVTMKEYLNYIQGVESVMHQIHRAQYLAFGPNEATEMFEVQHTFTVIPSAYKFLYDTDDETMDVDEVLAYRRTPPKPIAND